MVLKKKMVVYERQFKGTAFCHIFHLYVFIYVKYTLFLKRVKFLIPFDDFIIVLILEFTLYIGSLKSPFSLIQASSLLKMMMYDNTII